MSDLSKDIQEETSEQWDIGKLFDDLNDIVKTLNNNNKGLSDKNKKFLCLLLTGHSPKIIAQKIQMQESSVKSELSKYLYNYINTLLNIKFNREDIIQDWRDISRFLDAVGYKINPPDNRVRESELPSAIGWIYLGSVDDTSGQRPSFLTKLKTKGQQPVTISPMRVPRKRSIVTVTQFVNLREDRPREFHNYDLPNKVREIMPGTELVILDLDAFVDRNTNNPFTRVWAEVGDPPMTKS